MGFFCPRGLLDSKLCSILAVFKADIASGILRILSLAADLLPTSCVVLCVHDAEQAEREPSPLWQQNTILVIMFEVKFKYLFMHLLKLVNLASRRKAAKLIYSVMKVRFDSQLNNLRVLLHGPRVDVLSRRRTGIHGKAKSLLPLWSGIAVKLNDSTLTCWQVARSSGVGRSFR